MSFLGKEGFFFFFILLDSGSLIERLVGYKALKAENTVLVCRYVQTSSPLFRGHFYILGGFIFLLLFMLFLTWLTEKYNKFCVCREQYWGLWNVRKWRDLEITLSGWLSKGLGGALEIGIISEAAERSFCGAAVGAREVDVPGSLPGSHAVKFTVSPP